MHLEQINISKLNFLVNTYYDPLFKHFLTYVQRLLFIRLYVFLYPPVYIASIHTPYLPTKPPIFVFLNLDIVPNQLRPVP
jgi:hypothetical protein